MQEKSTEQLYKYWMTQCKQAERLIPKDDWKRARERLSAKEKDDSGKESLPVVNDFRNHFESSRAYLDQRDPAFSVHVAKPFVRDPISQKIAACNKAYLEYVWSEQECQKQQSRKLLSVLERNIGFTMPFFDTKKWMPSIKYLPAEDVRLDPNARGILENIQWFGYREFISFKDVLIRFPNISKEDIERLKKRGEYSVDDSELEKISDDDREQYRVCTVWNIFAKNSAALIGKDDDEQKEPNKVEVEFLKKDTKTRHIQFVEGLPKVLHDAEWPFKLDHNEFLLTWLTFNMTSEGFYGYTDYRQMERMDKMSDNVMSYIETDAFLSSIRKWLAGPNCPDEAQLMAFLNDTRIMAIPDMLDDSGKPKLIEASLRQPDPTLVQKYELLHNEATKASGHSELMAESMSDFKEVTALGVQFQEQKLHNRVNLRLGGASGYEKSIQEDAQKMLQIAHQFVPKYSEVLVKTTVPQVVGDVLEDVESEIIQTMPWDMARQALVQGATLLKLGVDAIVGDDLANYWQTLQDTPIEEIRLSTKVAVVPGSTRSITDQRLAEDMTRLYNEALWPTLYQPLGRFDLAAKYLTHIGQLKGWQNMEDLIPDDESIQQFLQQQQEQMQAQQQMEGQQQEAQMQGQQDELETKKMANEMELQHQAVKNEMEIDREQQKMAMQKEAMRNKKRADV